MLSLKRSIVTVGLTSLALVPGAPTLPVQAAGMVVNTVTDANPPATDGLCSLREAITNANNNAATHPDCPAGAGADTVTFSVSGTIVLAAALPNIIDAEGLTIDGSGHSVVVNGNNAVRPFGVTSGAEASLKSLTVTAGRASDGGGIYNSGSLTLTNSTVRGSGATYSGGGVYSNGTLTLANSTVSDNSVTYSDGGGVSNDGGALTLTDTTISGNRIDSGIYLLPSGGGGISSRGGALTVTNSTISGNSAGIGINGGGLYNRNGVATVTKSTIYGNTGGAGGGLHTSGAMTITSSIVANNTGGNGCGIYSEGTLTVANSMIYGNSGGEGGGIKAYGGELTVTDSTITGNVATTRGGGISSAYSSVAVTRSTIGRNAAYGAIVGGYGGGIFNDGGPVTLTDSTISGNVGGGVGHHGGYGYEDVAMAVTNSTISGNTHTYGGGVTHSNPLKLTNSIVYGNTGGEGGGTLTVDSTLMLKNSIVAGNTANGAGSDCIDNGGTLTATGPNLIGTLSGCAITGTPPLTGDPKLGPLADNGGPTQTHALLLGSPAIDAGDDAACAAAPVSGKDQRGVIRPQGAHCDLGSFELVASLPVVGGKNLRITTGSIDLAWDGGTTQTGYTLLRYIANNGTSTLIPLPANATSYSDATALPGGLYCYALAATGAGDVVLGLSDLECAMAGIQAGSPVPRDFALKLGSTSNATLTWTTPSGGADSYLLQRLFLDGSPPSPVTLPGSATTSTQALPTAGSCFLLVAYNAGAWGASDALCGIPGFSTLGNQASRRVQAVGEAMAEIEQRLATVAMPAIVER